MKEPTYIDNGKSREMSAYNFAFVNNSATIYFYKSRRKHAKVIKEYYIRPLIPRLGDDMICHKISSEHLKAHFLEIFRSLIHYSKRNDINISVSCNEWKNVVIHGEKKAQSWYWETERKHFTDFREASRWLYYNLFCRIYPYCEVDFAEVDFNDRYKEIDFNDIDD
jgi:hypothetical protein